MTTSFVPGLFSPLSALRFPEYRLLWSGTLLGSLGNWIQQFALGWLIVEISIREETPALAAFYLGLVGLARLAPALIFGLIGGVYADRLDRRLLLIATRIVSAVIAVGLAFLTGSGQIDVALVMLGTGLATAAYGFDSSARFAILPSLLTGRELFSGMGFMRAMQQSSLFLGPMLGGLLIISLGVAGLLGLVALMYVSAFVLSVLMSPRPVSARARGMSVRDSLVEGWTYLRTEPRVRPLLTFFAFFSVLGQSFIQLLPAVAHHSLGVGAVELSWFVGASGAGAVVGSLIAASLGGIRRFGPVLLGAAAVLGCALIVFGLQRNLIASICLLLLMGTANITFAGTNSNLVQMFVPDELRGRVLGLLAATANAGAPFGALILGVLGAFTGVSTALLAAGVGLLAATVFVALRVAAIRDVEPALAGVPERQVAAT